MAAKKSVEELLSSTTAKWICPITKKEFDPSDSEAIQQHKDKLIAADKEKEQLKAEAAKRKAINKKFKDSYAKCTSVRAFEALICSYLKDLGYTKSIPTFTYLSEKSQANKELTKPVSINSHWDKACIKITNVSVEAKKALTLLLGSYSSKDNTYYLPDVYGDAHVSNLLKKYFKRHHPKLSEEARQRLLTESSEYRELIQQMSSLAAVIHEHREVVRTVNAKMADIRSGVSSSNHPDDMCL